MYVTQKLPGSTATHGDPKAIASFSDHTLTVDFKRLGEATSNMDRERMWLEEARAQMKNATASAQGEAQLLRSKFDEIECRLATNEAAITVKKKTESCTWWELAIGLGFFLAAAAVSGGAGAWVWSWLRALS